MRLFALAFFFYLAPTNYARADLKNYCTLFTRIFQPPTVDVHKPWPFAANEKVIELPQELSRYAGLNTDVFTVVKVLKGEHGGNRLVVKRRGPWFDLRKDFIEGGGDLTQDLRLFPTLFGRDSWFFGYRWLDKEHAILPDVDELNGAISKFNAAAGSQSSAVLKISYYEEPLTLTPSKIYLERFVKEYKLPMSIKGRQFFHDMSSHALEDYWVLQAYFDVARNRAKMWLEFVEDFRAHHAPGPLRDTLRDVHATVMDKLAGDIDKLGMSPSDYLPSKSNVFLGRVGHQVKETPREIVTELDNKNVYYDYNQFTGSGVVKGNVKDFDQHALLEKDVLIYFLARVQDPSLRRELEIFVEKYKTEHPGDLDPFAHPLIETSKKIAAAVNSSSDPEQRLRVLQKIPTAAAYVDRQRILQTLTATPSLPDASRQPLINLLMTNPVR